MNKVVLMGRLTRDPEIRYSNQAEPMAIARYTLAVDRQISRERRDAGEQAADFINCTCFRRDAEFVERFFRKGQMVCVSGRLQIRSFDDNNGQRQWYTEVVTNDHTFAESRASFEQRQGQGGGNNQSHYNTNYGDNQNYMPPAQPQQQPAPQQQPGPTGSGPGSDSFFQVDNNPNPPLSDDDLPF